MFAYVAIAPTRGTGVFLAMNGFNIGGLSSAIAAAAGLITSWRRADAGRPLDHCDWHHTCPDPERR